MSISVRIQIARKSLGFSAKQFARSINTTHQKILDIEQDRQRAPQDVLSNIVSTHNICGNWLLTGEGRPLKDITTDDILFEVLLRAQINKIISKQQAIELAALLDEITNAKTGA